MNNTNSLVRYYNSFTTETLIQLYKDYMAEINNDGISSARLNNYFKRLTAIQSILDSLGISYKGNKK